MLWSKLFIPTLREEPSNFADPAQKLLVRAGYLRRLAAGGWAYLPMARRALGKIVGIVREEFDGIGAQELLLPPGRGIEQLAGEIRSPKQLPQIWYQFQAGLECWTLDDGEVSRGAVAAAFRRILDRCGLRYEVAGTRLVWPSDAGGQTVVRGTNYIAPLEEAETVAAPPLAPDPAGDLPPEPFPTPGVKSIADIAAFTGLPETSQIKSLVMMAGAEPVLALLRGDHLLSEEKLARQLGRPVRSATAEEIRKWFGADAGSLGPVGVDGIRVLADLALRGRRNMIAGANRNEYHLRHVTPGEDFQAEFMDLRLASPEDTSIHGSPIQFEKVREMARLGEQKHGIDIEQLVFTLAEQNHDKDGLLLPAPVAPYDLVVTAVAYSEAAQREAAAKIAGEARAAGLDALIDDRDERPGVKFKDADLVGFPYRVNLGRKLAEGMVELVERRSKQVTELPLPEAVAVVRTRLPSGTSPAPAP